MFTGALVHRMNAFKLPQAGGCKLGSRTVRPHLYALEKFGVHIETTDNFLGSVAHRASALRGHHV